MDLNVVQPNWQSKPVLYLPDRLYQWQPHRVQHILGVDPTPGVNPYYCIPFPQMDYYSGILPTTVRCTRLANPPLCVQKAQTAPSTAVQQLPLDSRLHTAFINDALWENLKAYVDDKLNGVPIAAPVPGRLSTWTLSQPPALPDPAQQRRAIGGIKHWYELQIAKEGPTLVNSEPAVQDEFRTQIIDALNLLIRTRYPNRAGVALTESTRNIGIWPFQATGFYPLWTRAVNASNMKLGLVDDATKKGGFPDFLLARDPNLPLWSAVVEVKFWKGLADHQFETVFKNSTLQNTTGVFTWNARNYPSLLLKQLWGEVIFQNAIVGAVTNGNLVTVFMRTGQNQLSFSPLLPWNSPDLLHVMAGLTFLSIDFVDILANQNTNDFVPIAAAFCPQATRRANW